MGNVTSEVEKVRTAITQVGIGFGLALISLPTKFVILFLIGAVVFGLGIRGLYKAYVA